MNWFFLFSIIVVSIISFITTRFWLIRRSREKSKSPSCSVDRSTGTMIRKLIHEIRNPLNSMSLHLQLLTEDLEIEVPSDYTNDLERVQRIQNEIQRLEQLLSSFQRYANLPHLQFEVVDLKRVIEDVIDFNAPETIQQGIEVNCQIEDLPPISLDVDQIKQAILNLILNANQSMDKGGKLYIRAKLLDAQVQIEIEDTGVGIAPCYQDKIFDLFFSTKHDGTGIGLVLVKEIIEGHGGEVQVESQQHQGTKVVLHLPTDLEVN